MVCKNCGASISKGDLVCPQCGMPQSGDSEVMYTSSYVNALRAQRHRRQIALYGGIAVLALALIGCGIWLAQPNVPAVPSAPTSTPVVMVPTASPTPTPTPEATYAPVETPTQEPTATPTATPTPAPTPTAEPTATPIMDPDDDPPAVEAPTKKPVVTRRPTSTKKPLPTLAPAKTAEPTFSPAPSPTATPVVTPTPVPTSTPEPTPTPVPTPTPGLTEAPKTRMHLRIWSSKDEPPKEGWGGERRIIASCPAFTSTNPDVQAFLQQSVYKSVENRVEAYRTQMDAMKPEDGFMDVTVNSQVLGTSCDYAIILTWDIVKTSGKTQVLYHSYVADLNARKCLTLSDLADEAGLKALNAAVRAALKDHKTIQLPADAQPVQPQQDFYLDADGIVLTFATGELPGADQGAAIRLTWKEAGIASLAGDLPAWESVGTAFPVAVGFPSLPDTTPAP